MSLRPGLGSSTRVSSGSSSPETKTTLIGLVAALVVALGLLSWLGRLSYSSMLRAEEDQRWVVHTHLVLQKLDSVLQHVISVGASKSDYVQNDESNRSSYGSDLDAIRENLNDVSQLTLDNPTQQQALQQLRPLISGLLAGSNKTLTASGKQAVTTGINLRERTESQSLLEITDRVTRMKAAESQLLVRRTQTAQASVSRVKTMIVLGNLLAAAFLALAATALYKEMGNRNKFERELHKSEERFRLMVSSVKDYAIFMLDPGGRVISWNLGAERIKGYRADEIIGQHFSCFYPEGDVQNCIPEQMLRIAIRDGRIEDEGWRLRKDGSRFWARVVITALFDSTGHLTGFSKVSCDITERKRAEQKVSGLLEAAPDAIVVVN